MANSSRRRSWGWSPPTTRTGWPTSMRWLVALIAAPLLVFAANTAMLGVSRHTYTLAVNRQIPSWLGQLGRRYEVPYKAILICAVAVFALAVIGDVELLAGIYAFGATLAITIAHVSVIKLRRDEPDRLRPYRIPWNVNIRGTAVPLPAVRRSGAQRTGAGLGRAAPRRGPLGRPRLAAVRTGRLRDLPQGDRAGQPDQAGHGRRPRADPAEDLGRASTTSSCRSSARNSTTTSSAPPAAWPPRKTPRRGRRAPG